MNANTLLIVCLIIMGTVVTVGISLEIAAAVTDNYDEDGITFACAVIVIIAIIVCLGCFAMYHSYTMTQNRQFCKIQVSEQLSNRFTDAEQYQKVLRYTCN